MYWVLLTAYVSLHRNHVPGGANTRSAQGFVVRNATVNDAMNHAVRDYQEALVFTATHVSGSVGSSVPSSAEFVIKTK